MVTRPFRSSGQACYAQFQYLLSTWPFVTKYRAPIRKANSTNIGQSCETVKEVSFEILLIFPINNMPIKNDAVTNQPSTDTGTHNLLLMPLNQTFFFFMMNNPKTLNTYFVSIARGMNIFLRYNADFGGATLKNMQPSDHTISLHGGSYPLQ